MGGGPADFKEAPRKKILWTALGVGLGFLVLFALAEHYQSFSPRVTPLVRRQILNTQFVVGLYALNFLLLAMTVLTSVDTLSGEIASGTIHALAAKPNPAPQTSSEAAPKPLLLEEDEGEQRIWRDPPPGGFTLKVSPKNNGSQHLVFGTEDMFPGDEIPRRKHLGQDEIVFIQKGTLHVRLPGLCP